MTIALGTIISHLDYSNSLFMGLPSCDINKLQRIQNLTAKIILGKSKYDSSTEALRELHWLPIEQRIKFKILVIMFRCIVLKTAPQYLTEMFHMKAVGTMNLRSNCGSNLVRIPRTKRKTFKSRGLSVVGPQLWNALPDALRVKTTLDSFKKDLKTLLFKEYFG